MSELSFGLAADEVRIPAICEGDFVEDVASSLPTYESRRSTRHYVSAAALLTTGKPKMTLRTSSAFMAART